MLLERPTWAFTDISDRMGRLDYLGYALLLYVFAFAGIQAFVLHEANLFDISTLFLTNTTSNWFHPNNIGNNLISAFNQTEYHVFGIILNLVFVPLHVKRLRDINQAPSASLLPTLISCLSLLVLPKAIVFTVVAFIFNLLFSVYLTMAEGDTSLNKNGFPTPLSRIQHKFFTTRGRTGRRFFGLTLLTSVITLSIFLLSQQGLADLTRRTGSLFLHAMINIGVTMLALCILYSLMCITIKRMHDLNKPGWWLIIIPIALFIDSNTPYTVPLLSMITASIFLLVLLLTPGTPEKNRYNPHHRIRTAIKDIKVF